MNHTLTALLHGPDSPGLVARVAGWIFEQGGNIIHADQHRDAEEGIFFQRVEWWPPVGDAEAHAGEFRVLGESLGMRVEVHRSDERPRVAVFVSKIDHCFHDLLIRWKTGELACEIPLIISNHTTLAPVADYYGIPFYHIPVTADTKEAAETRQLNLLQEHSVELVVMARYMQILSERFLTEAGCPVINIHHSFLPAFQGARPYHKAYARGVKLIGATAHFATPDLDEGPIIQQDVTRVSHRNAVNDLVRKGRDLEKIVLAQAVRWQLEHRVLVYGNKTVVFD